MVVLQIAPVAVILEFHFHLQGEVIEAKLSAAPIEEDLKVCAAMTPIHCLSDPVRIIGLARKMVRSAVCASN